MIVDLEQESPVATVVPETQRLHFLPFLFGRYFVRGESLVYSWMNRLCETYSGGYWEYVKLSNGGGYMAPKCDGWVRLSVEGNQFEGEMSADAAGIVVSLFALCQLANQTYDDAITQRYYALRIFARNHAEENLILRAID